MSTKINIKKVKKYKTNPNRIKGLMLLQDLTLKATAERLEITRTYLTYVLHGVRYGLGARQRLAKLLNLPYEELWGQTPSLRDTPLDRAEERKSGRAEERKGDSRAAER